LPLLLALVILPTLFTGCAYLNDNSVYQNYYDEEDVVDVEPQPIQRTDISLTIPDDGVLRLAMRHPLTLNPLLNEDVTVAKILRMIFEPLVVFDENLRPTGNLADLEMASDFSRATLTIRNDAIWSDGIPVSSDDLIFSVGVLRLAPSTVIYKNNVNNIASLERIDSRTVVVHFSQPSAMAAYCLNFPIIPEHHYRGHNIPTSVRNMEPLGNGPFMFYSITPKLSMSLIRSPYSLQRRAQIHDIKVVFIPDAETKIHAFDQGVIDAIRLPFSEWIKHHSVKPVNHEAFPAMYFEFVGFNFDREVFQELNVRQAVVHAINTDEAMTAAYLHQAIRAISPIHPQSWMHDYTISGLEFNPTRAASMLRDIHQEEDLIILTNAEHIERTTIAKRLAASLQTVGLPAQVVIVPFDEFIRRLNYGDFDLYIGGMQLDIAPSFDFMFYNNDESLFAHDAELANLFANLYTATSEETFLQAVSHMQQEFATRVPIISLGFRHSAVLTSTRVEQTYAPATDHIFLSIHEWRIR